MKPNNDAIQEFFQKTFDNILKELHEEIGRLKTWMKQDFPESRLDVGVHVDNIRRTLTVTTRVLMGEEMVANRGFFENKLVLPEKRLINPSFMQAFFGEFNNEYRKQIANSINAHYNRFKSDGS